MLDINADIMMSMLPLSWKKREAIFPINLCLCRTLGRPGADTSFGLFKEFRNLDLHTNTNANKHKYYSKICETSHQYHLTKLERSLAVGGRGKCITNINL